MEFDPALIDQWHRSGLLLLGGSAGSFKLLLDIVEAVPPDLNKVIIIVMHRRKNFSSEIEKLFAQNTRMLLVEIIDKQEIALNTIYMAPANYHTLLEAGGYFSLDVSDALWYSKPSIDITFESIADNYEKTCTAILLSGASRDGAAGLLKLREAGHLTIAQDPDDAEMSEMPESAIRINANDHILTSAQILELLKI